MYNLYSPSNWKQVLSDNQFLSRGLWEMESGVSLMVRDRVPSSRAHGAPAGERDNFTNALLTL